MNGGVTSLATDVIAARALAGSVIGVLGTGFVAGFLDAHRARRAFLWILLIYAFGIPLLLGPAGFGLIAGRVAQGLPIFAVYMAVAASVVSSLWLSLIAVQIVQNAVAQFF